MSAGAALETVIGLVFVFAITALLCSAVCEAVANLLQMRAKYLLRGLRTMLDSSVTGKTSPRSAAADAAPVDIPADEKPMRDLHRQTTDPELATTAAASVNSMAVAAHAELAGGGVVTAVTHADLDAELQEGGLTLALFGHPLLRSLQSNRVGLLGSTHRNPSYLSAKTFARVLIDTLVPDDQGKTTLAAVTATVEKLPDALPAKKSLLTLVRRSGNNLAHFESLVEDWYDEHMARISGWYKRWAKLVLATVGLVVAVLVNVDTINVGRQLYVDEPIRAAVLSQVNGGSLCRDETDPAKRTTCVQGEISKLDAAGLPVWWSHATRPGDAAGWAVKIIGFLLTAFAVSFGAPFWFDALSKLGSLRTAGPRPEGAGA